MQAVDDVEAAMDPVRARSRRATRASQVARLWALSDSDEAERDALRSTLERIHVEDPEEPSHR